MTQCIIDSGRLILTSGIEMHTLPVVLKTVHRNLISRSSNIITDALIAISVAKGAVYDSCLALVASIKVHTLFEVVETMDRRGVIDRRSIRMERDAFVSI